MTTNNNEQDFKETERNPHAWGLSTLLCAEEAFRSYTGLEGLREAYYLGVESCNCSGCIPNEYPSDDPKHKAWIAGFRFGIEQWGPIE